MSHHILRHFRTDHLHPQLANVAAPFTQLADALDKTIADSAEKTTALRKLLEAKDCAVRAALEQLEP